MLTSIPVKASTSLSAWSFVQTTSTLCPNPRRSWWATSWAGDTPPGSRTSRSGQPREYSERNFTHRPPLDSTSRRRWASTSASLTVPITSCSPCSIMEQAETVVPQQVPAFSVPLFPIKPHFSNFYYCVLFFLFYFHLFYGMFYIFIGTLEQWNNITGNRCPPTLSRCSNGRANARSSTPLSHESPGKLGQAPAPR